MIVERTDIIGVMPDPAEMNRYFLAGCRMKLNTPAGPNALMFRQGANQWFRNDLRGTCTAMPCAKLPTAGAKTGCRVSPA